MGQQENRYLKFIYDRYPGRVAIGVAYSQEMNEIFPVVIDDGHGQILGIVAMAVMVHDDIAAVHIYHFSVFSPKLGNGTKMLTILCRQADRFKIALSLTPIPSSGGDDHCISYEKLAIWYRQFGFEGDTLLCRPPLNPPVLDRPPK